MYVQCEGQRVHLTVRHSIFQGRGPECTIYVGGESTLAGDRNLFYRPHQGRCSSTATVPARRQRSASWGR